MANERFVLKLRSPMTLRSLCIERVARMAIQFKANMEKEEVCLPMAFEDNHFVDVPRSIIEEIIAKMASENFVRRYRNYYRHSIAWRAVFRVLLIKPIERFEFYINESNVNSLHGALDMFKLANTQLKALKLTGTSHSFETDTPICRAMIMAMPSLTHLEMKDVFSDDALLETIGISCPHLTFLSVSVRYCSGAGIRNLCTNADGTMNRCQKLHTLEIDDYIITDDVIDGIVALLPGLPELVVFKCDTEARARVFKRLLRNSRQGRPTQLNIRAVEYYDYYLASYPVTALVQMCPHLEVLELEHTASSYVENLRTCPVIASLKNVTFYMDYDDWNESAFENCVTPFLERNGKFLQVLRLDSIVYVNCTTINHLCPNLKKLILGDICILDGVLSPTPLFTKLDTLEFYEMSTERGTEIIKVIQLLSNIHNVRNLKVHCPWLKKQHFQDIISCKGCCHLLSIDIDSDYLYIKGKVSDSETPLSDTLRTALKL